SFGSAEGRPMGRKGTDEDETTRPSLVGFGLNAMRRRFPHRIDDVPRIELPGAETGGSKTSEELGAPLNVRAVAALIGCSPWTVRQTLIPKGLPCFRSAASGRLIFYRQQVVRWILRQQRRQEGLQR